jgi:hypothetical protein
MVLPGRNLLHVSNAFGPPNGHTVDFIPDLSEIALIQPHDKTVAAKEYERTS